jgi:hypothetical protein
MGTYRIIYEYADGVDEDVYAEAPDKDSAFEEGPPSRPYAEILKITVEEVPSGTPPGRATSGGR